jgi:hypothetical protein
MTVNELGRIQREVVMSYSKVLSQKMSQETAQSQKNFTEVSLWVENGSWNLPNTKHKCQPLSHELQSE